MEQNKKHTSHVIGVKKAPIELRIDASEAINQIEQLTGLFELQACALQGIPENIFSQFLSNVLALVNNIGLSDFSTTVCTTDAGEITLKVKIIGPLEKFAAAIRAGDLHSLLLQHN